MGAAGFSLLQYAAYKGQIDAFKLLLDHLPTQDKIDHFQVKSPLQLDLAGTLVSGWLCMVSAHGAPALRRCVRLMLDVDETCFERCLEYLARKASTSADGEYKAMEMVLEQAEIRTPGPMRNGIAFQAESVRFDKKYFKKKFNTSSSYRHRAVCAKRFRK